MISEKGNTQALFHFLLSELLVECSENIKNHEQEDPLGNRLKEIGINLGFKIFTQICLKRGITERPSSINDLLKSIKSKVFKHLFNYELLSEINVQQREEKKTIAYGIVDDISIYLAWMPYSCQLTASMLVAGIIQGILKSNDVQSTVNAHKLQSNKQDRIVMLYQIQIDMEENNRWQKK